ncbi:laminin subunit alpha-like [Centruroides sculpturatus]|uniref:laminin subunit alpha-like n=1 Tax=Centruroides sculpturatus TaxID=218467 RepID=UPI000C6EEC2C|nr:laminin subunit alpha-like [Centruroides sculpturatus]
MSFGGENVMGTITFTPEGFSDIQQSSDMVFEATTQPRLMRVAGKQGLTAAPFVLNPGRWTVSIRVENPLFLDYMVLLPQAYYEATLLQEAINIPCELGQENESCRHFRYPLIPEESSVVRGEAGYVAFDDQRIRTQLYQDEYIIEELETEEMAWLNSDQTSLHLDMRVSKPGEYVFVIIYYTPENVETANVMVELSTTNKMDKGIAVLYECTYSFLCREVVMQADGQIAIFDIDSNSLNLQLTIGNNSNVIIDSIAAIPYDMWHSDFIVPQSQCIKKDGKCLEIKFPPVPDATKIEFESGFNEERIASDLPVTIFDKDAKLIYLNYSDAMVDIQGSVPDTGKYVLVVHYYQPDHPSFEMDVIIQNGQFYEAVLPIKHCPDSSGCRAVVKEKITSDVSFQILKNFVLTLKEPNHKSVWVDYVLAIPSSQYDESLLHPLPQDKAGKFITNCGQNNFYITPDASEYCRESTFSLTSEYNNGALQCKCDTDGSYSYECNEFGGQCNCRPNVIGRTCSRCQTGFFGFPNCKPCNCPSTAICHPTTGQCICPPRVTGEKCDMCIPHTYGFDAIIGCEECSCNPLGVDRGNLQCDLDSGQCECKSNIVGRACDRCKSGYWAFPLCHLCSCDLRGTTEEICDQDNSRCHCKENVFGDFCDQCRPGTFYLEENNPAGCSKCFCFGTTDRCYSSYFLFTQISDYRNWKSAVVRGNNHLIMEDTDVEIEERSFSVTARLDDLPTGTLFYFSAPFTYLGNKIKSYGGNLQFTLSTEDHESIIGSIIGPDIILMGNNITIVHNHVEQPSEDAFEFQVNIIEREFQHLTGGEVSREQMMMVLVNLELLLIRGTHFQPPITITLSNVVMDVMSDNYVADGPKALRVEQCQCPPNYQGTSCEECAPGYYRSKTGPYLGFCVPCQCNGNSESCDVKTGKCFNCRHHTTGDHCELCAPGYHGDATKNDCLICACPQPNESNNFAESCEVSPSGFEISCNCKPGYYGPRCEVCAAGYYGQPEVRGSQCLPCQCSGNIDTNIPGSCDSVTGECVLCLNNTFGAACELCAPGYYGDAISQKDCKPCDCDSCGTSYCNHNTGECVCHHNVIGYECDQCAPNHWGFSRCQGCAPCNCEIASNSQQCDLETGQCDCKPGVTGMTCGICEPGYWLYSPEGCISCNCDEKYSAGAVCNPDTGLCQCLPGVIGDKCDRCPYRWAFVDKIGCHECGPCVHALLDDTDYLKSVIDPVWEEMTDISTSYFAYQRLNNVNKSVHELWPKVNAFNRSEIDLTPLLTESESIELTAKVLDLKTSESLDESHKLATEADNTRKTALEVEKLIHEAAWKAEELVKELKELAEGLTGSVGPSTDLLITEAERILDELKTRDFSEQRKVTEEESELARELLEQVKDFQIPMLLNKADLDKLKERVKQLENFVTNYIDNANEANKLTDDYRKNAEYIKNIPTLETVNKIGEKSEMIEELLDKALDLLEKAEKLLNDAENNFDNFERDFESMLISGRELANNLEDLEIELEELRPQVEEAKLYAEDLAKQALLLDSLLADTRNSSEGAVKAATVYQDIILAIDDAEEAAKDALRAADEAGIKSEGVAERAENSRNISEDLLNTARLLEQQVAEDLKPKLDYAKKGVSSIGQQNEKNSRDLDIIDKELEKLPFRELQNMINDANDKSVEAENLANRVQEDIENILLKIQEDRDTAEEIPINLDEIKDAVKTADKYLDLVKTIDPEIDDLLEKVGKKETAVRITGKDVSDKIAELRQKVALAQNQANRIKLGVRFFDNTTLQLRNPEGLDRSATYTHMSLYFNTEKSDGLLIYVGNEKGTHNLIWNALTDDFMALEVQAGRLVLSVDLGYGVNRIVNDRYVADGVWHQAIIERTGKTFTLTVRTEREDDSVKQDVLPGTYSVFNLDQHHSKFYIGGIPDDAKIQAEVLSRHFIGCIEELEFGKTPVGLWNFVKAENNFEGCIERDAFVTLQPSNGLRFDGTGYAILPIRRHNFKRTTDFSMEIKTYASEGLLFLIGKNRNFLAMELRQGKVLLKYNLGDGLVTLISNVTVNDGNWHVLGVSRYEGEAILKIQGVEVDSGKSPGPSIDLSTTDDIFIGGYPRNHGYSDVTNVDFEGCIDNVQIGTQLQDLNNNKEALGVVSGCPPMIARTISFSNITPGYVAMPNINLRRKAELTFKFKTEEDGLLFYADNEEHLSYLSISLKDGRLIMKSNPGGEIITKPDIRYNDKKWHYVTATKTNKEMHLNIDDIDFNDQEVSARTNLIITSPLYFGGVPDDYSINADAVPSKRHFIGCLGDTTVIGLFQNFADSQDRPGASLTTCPLAEPSHIVTIQPDGSDLEPTETIYTPEPIPPSKCYLPLHPKPDLDVKPEDGLRYGNTPWSRQEFSIRGSTILEESQFSLEFKTRLFDGILLYVAGKGQIDFEALFMQDGKIHYTYNCGSGGTVISTTKAYNDDLWHRADFSRSGKEGILIVDEEEITGESPGQTSSMNVKPPLYVGGLSEATARIAKNNLKGVIVPFPGCIRNVRLRNEELTKRITSVNVTGCSDKVEEGTFISADGGYVILYDKFNVGKQISVSMKIKPRKTSGVLMAVHGSKDYLVVQMIDGMVKFTVDDGGGPYSAVYNPPSENYLCDGDWHSIRIVKTSNVAIVTVDDVTSDPKFGPGAVTATDTNDPLYLGGVPDPGSLKGVEVTEHFVGCIGSVNLNDQKVWLTQGRVFGQVTLNSCPRT